MHMETFKQEQGYIYLFIFYSPIVLLLDDVFIYLFLITKWAKIFIGNQYRHI